jgi:hypothetical protein
MFEPSAQTSGASRQNASVRRDGFRRSLFGGKRRSGCSFPVLPLATRYRLDVPRSYRVTRSGLARVTAEATGSVGDWLYSNQVRRQRFNHCCLLINSYRNHVVAQR